MWFCTPITSFGYIKLLNAMIQCPECDSSFKDSTDTSAHLNNKHRGISYTPDDFKGLKESSKVKTVSSKKDDGGFDD